MVTDLRRICEQFSDDNIKVIFYDNIKVNFYDNMKVP